MRRLSSTKSDLVNTHPYSLLLHSVIYPLFLLSNRFFNETELKNSAKHKIETKQNIFSLTVNKCDHPDVGTYHVHVDNGIDHTEQTAKLNVGGMFFYSELLLSSMHFFL
jgi:hypothetical protein